MGSRKSDMFGKFKKRQDSRYITADTDTQGSFSSVEFSITDLKTVLEQMHAPQQPAQTLPEKEEAFVSQVQAFDAPAAPVKTEPAAKPKAISKEEIMREIREKARAEARSSFAGTQHADFTVTQTVVEPMPAPAKLHETFEKITAHATPVKETVRTPAEEMPETMLALTAQPEAAEPQEKAEAASAEQPAESVPTPFLDFGTVFGEGKETQVYKTSFSQAVHSLVDYAKLESSKKAAALLCSVIAALILVAAFTSHFSFAYAAVIDGEYVGVVGDKNQCEAVLDEINGVLETNFGADEVVEHKVSVYPRIIKKDAYTSEEDLRNAIYSLSDKMLDMYVIYAGKTQVCALSSLEAAQNALTEFELFYTGGEENVSFSTDTPLEIKEELAPVTLLCEVGEAVNILNGTEKKEGEYTVQSGDTLWAIARAYDTTVNDLMSLNPEKGETIREGDTLRVMAYEPVVTVTTVSRIDYDETIDYTTEVVETESMYRGNSQITQQGEDGKRHITADLVKVNGLEVRRDIIEETVTKAPVTQIKKVGTAEPPKGYGSGTFSAPCHGTITSYFGTRRSGFHKGIDIANSYGTPIRAADNGRVIYAGWDGTGFGRLVKLDHQNGYITYYGHNSRIAVSVGQAVNKGDVIAYMGSTGNSTGNHCHFEMYKNGALVNPYKYIF